MGEVLCRRCLGSGEGDPASDRPLCWICDGTGYVAGCSVEGCERPSEETCDLCSEEVCTQHSRWDVGMRLCFSCHIGMSEGMSYLG